MLPFSSWGQKYQLSIFKGQGKNIMTEEKQLPIISLIVPFGILVSLLYLFGYWSTFGINILHFAALTDVIKLAIYPLFISAVLSFAGLYFQALVRGQFSETEPSKVFIELKPPAIRWVSIIASVSMIATIAVLHGNGFALSIAGVFLAFIVNINIGPLPVLKPFLPNPVIRQFASWAILVVLFSSFGRGRQDAEEILKGKDGKVVSTAIFKGKGTEEFKSKGLLEKHETLKYLGAAGDYFFFLTPDNTETIIAKYEDLYFIDFRKQ